MRLFSNRSQRTSKCGKNTFLFLPHFDVICDLLLNRRTATWNLFVNQIVYYVFSEHNAHLWIGVTQQPNKLFYDAIICQKSVIKNNKLIDC